MTNDDILAFALKYRYDEPDASGYDFGTRSLMEFAHAIRNAALEESALAVRKLIEDHAASSKEPVGDTSCDFQCAWVDAEKAIRALKTKE